MRDCLIIVGMHRSGTSALSGCVHRLGLAVGSDIVAPQDDNVRGYYEHRGVLALHEDLLAASGSSWDDIAPRTWRGAAETPAIEVFQRDLATLLNDEFAESPAWTVKDPRLCHLLPVWLPVLEDLGVTPRIVIAHRRAAEVAASLKRRNRFSPGKANALWAQHLLAAERASRGLRRTFIDFSALLDDPVGELERAADQLDFTWPVSPPEAANALAEFLDHDLPKRVDTPRGDDLIAALEAALSVATQSPDTSRFDELALRLGELGTPDPLVVEHLHQFARRETRTKIWEAKEPLERDLKRVSDRLGEGLAKVEAAVATLGASRSELATRLEAELEASQEHRRASDETAAHLTQVAAHLEDAARQHGSELDDIRLRLDRLQTTIDVEARLEALRRDLDFLSGEVARVRALADRKGWWHRLADRVAFWRSAPQPE